jgi:FkbM family methyltransferase
VSQNLTLDQKVLDRIVPQSQGNVFIDIGAHFGFFTAYLNTLASGRRDFKLIALEPDPNHFECLKMTMSRYADHNILLLPYALSDEGKEVGLFRTGDTCLNSYGLGTLEYYARGITLDSLVREYAGSDDYKVAVIKIDIDGAEASLFKGGERTLATSKPIICMEFAPTFLQKAGTDPERLYLRLSEEFNIYWICYQDNAVRRVGADDYATIAGVVKTAITDFVLSSDPLDFDGL